MVRQFGIFAKYWQPGAVKTRLARYIGDDAAATLHRACLETLLVRFAQLADRRVLAYSPSERGREFAAIAGPSWQTQPQVSGDLGRRMSHYFATSFATGCSAVVLIGSDSPTLPQQFVNDAFDRLQSTDAVLGPADDGGYYLIGLSHYVAEVFEGIDWSTANVRKQTLERFTMAGCRCDLLAPWYDVDTPADLDRLRAELAGNSSHEFASLRSLVESATPANGLNGR
jgi:rSAM/selenodomain-associated transferase 1